MLCTYINFSPMNPQSTQAWNIKYVMKVCMIQKQSTVTPQNHNLQSSICYLLRYWLACLTVFRHFFSTSRWMVKWCLELGHGCFFPSLLNITHSLIWHYQISVFDEMPLPILQCSACNIYRGNSQNISIHFSVTDLWSK